MIGKAVGGDYLAESGENSVEVGFSLGGEPEEGVGFFLADIRLDKFDLTLLLSELEELLTKEGSKRSDEDERG